MNIYDWMRETFVGIADNMDIEYAVVNDSYEENGGTYFRRFQFLSYNRALEWAMINRNKYDIDDRLKIVNGAESGVTIYIKQVSAE